MHHAAAKAAELVEAAIGETLAYYAFPEEHWRRIRTTDEIDKGNLHCRGLGIGSARLRAGPPRVMRVKPSCRSTWGRAVL